MHKKMNSFSTVTLVLLLLVLLNRSLFSHDQRVHQYIVVQAYELLKMKYPGIVNTPLNSFVGGLEGSCSDSPPFLIAKITAGAYREDCEDPVFRYDDVPLFFREACHTVSHFWDADNGDNSQLDYPLLPGSPFNNAYQKVLRYVKPADYGRWTARVFWGDLRLNGGWPCVAPKIRGVGLNYDNFINFYLTGDCYVAGYYDEVGDYTNVDPPCPVNIAQSMRDQIVYEVLGRIAHLIGDMGVPAHAHNDVHGPFPIDRDETFETEMSIRYDGWDAIDAYDQGGDT